MTKEPQPMREILAEIKERLLREEVAGYAQFYSNKPETDTTNVFSQSDKGEEHGTL